MSEKEFAPYNIITSDSEGYYEEKKSRFLAYVHPASSEEEAVSFIASIKKKHYDARHNCYAMIIGPKKEFKKASDDGEPQRTAGMPMLDVLEGSGLTNVVAVVTRYFGGTLLGTGGLVRSYQSALKDALTKADIRQVIYCADVPVRIPYTLQGELSYYFETNGIVVMSTEYAEDVIYNIR